ncbi:MAG: DUF167 domain-containing protein [Euryarchaeota archaeon]|nr:DUF167 domain-containing protein [Euryarchaeota archaeon]
MDFTQAIQITKQGILLKLHVLPNAKQSLFPVGYNSWRKCLEIKVNAETKDNKANQEVISCIATFFKIPPNTISIISGLKNKEKTVLLTTISKETIAKKLKEVFHEL